MIITRDYDISNNRGEKGERQRREGKERKKTGKRED
jgi:hypothetical protein